jgi:hypothetical protein
MQQQQQLWRLCLVTVAGQEHQAPPEDWQEDLKHPVEEEQPTLVAEEQRQQYQLPLLEQ